MRVQFKLNGVSTSLEVRGDERLLDVVRERLGLVGTKEGCGKGECGACTVLMDGAPVCSCLVLASQASGREITTIEGLSDGDKLHPVQSAFADVGAVQCGFCTPGVILASAALLARNPRPTREEIKRALSGNLCRCTGYEKIFAAVLLAAKNMRREKRSGAGKTGKRSADLVRGRRAAGPVTLREALRAMAAGNVAPVAGGTDLLVRLRDAIDRPWPNLLVLDAVKPLHRISVRKKRVLLGPLVTFSEIEESAELRKFAPQLVEAASIAGSVQIRNRATVGGNLANGSPAGDLLPPLYVLGARLELSSLKGKRYVEIEDFFKGPKLTVLRRNELITSVTLEKSTGRGFFLRLATRKALAISKVSVAADLSLREGVVKQVRIALGAVAPTVIRARRTEEFLLGRELNKKSIHAACDMVREEARPIDDIRSEARYRSEMVGVLLKRGLEGLAG